MNYIDKLVSYINPIKGMQRASARKITQVLNSGYSEGGASTTKKSMRGNTARSASPKEDIDYNIAILRNRSRDLYMNAPLATSAIKTTRTNVIGAGLKPKSRIDYNFLGLTEDQASEWKQNVDREFNLWAESVHCDALKKNNFYELQQIAQLGWLMSGDVFAALKMGKLVPNMPYALRVHLIEADRISTPGYSFVVDSNYGYGVEGKHNNGNRIINGLEIDKDGAIVAYHICNRYPNTLIINDKAEMKWTRVEAFGKLTGRPNILHLMDSERPEQLRGVPILAPVIETLKQLTRYTDAELMASVIAGMYTVFIKTSGPSSEMPMGSMLPSEQQVADDDPNIYELGNGAINVLDKDESIEIANPGRPNTAFDGFVNALSKYIGAALEIPHELLQKSFGQSYSASRAALLEAWKMFRMRRTWMATDFCQPVYEAWLDEAVALGRIKAPGYFSDPIIRKAWASCEWTGPAPGQLDPVKEATGSKIRVENGFSTREKEADEINGTDFESNMKQAKRENKLMEEAGLNAKPNGGKPVV